MPLYTVRVDDSENPSTVVGLIEADTLHDAVMMAIEKYPVATGQKLSVYNYGERGMTPEQAEDQRRIFAHGNAKLANPAVTRADVNAAADAMPKDGRLYARRDSEALGEHYQRHVSAMTAEGLHEKLAIAAELAWRDAQIEELELAFDIYHNAHVRAAERWQAAHPDRGDIWPDGGELIVWLMAEHDRLTAERVVPEGRQQR